MILDIKDLEFKYKLNHVLNGINLQIKEHEIVSILGPNGVGKTTLLKCINALLAPSKGSILIQKENIRELSQTKVAQKVGYVAQKNEVSRVTVFDAILLGRYPYFKWGISESDLKIVNSIIHKLHLEELSLRFIDELSGGELQKVCTARALVQEPEVLLLDEPTNNLDLKNQIEILELIHQIVVEHNVAAIMTMHDLNMALRYSDRFIFLKNGKIFASCKKEEVNEEIIEAVYDVPVTIKILESTPFIIPKIGITLNK